MQKLRFVVLKSKLGILQQENSKLPPGKLNFNPPVFIPTSLYIYKQMKTHHLNYIESA